MIPSYFHELMLIRQYYGTRREARSNRLLTAHIYEGVKLLIYLKAPEYVISAFCIHPLMAAEEDDQESNRLLGWVRRDVYMLAQEFNQVAYRYRLRMPRPGSISEFKLYVRTMLLADKTQNLKDFLKYHSGRDGLPRHPKYEELLDYFADWLTFLGGERPYEKYVVHVKVMEA